MSSPTPAMSPLAPITRTLVIIVAAIGFLFDTYELLMLPVIGANALAELLHVSPTDNEVRLWAGRILWISALSGGIFGLLGGWLVDRLGRKTVMIGSILMYSFSPVAAAYSTELWQLILFRCTTFIGVCVEMVAAVTWLAELFENKRTRELVIGWTLACASFGGILVTQVYIMIVAAQNQGNLPAIPFLEGHDPNNMAWRFTLLTGLIPGAMILALMPFVPESRVWAEKKRTGTLTRPSFGALFAPDLIRTTLVTAGLSACAYAAAFGALQMTPFQIVPGLPDLARQRAEITADEKKLNDRRQLLEGRSGDDLKQGESMIKDLEKKIANNQKALDQKTRERRGDIQRWQEMGGLSGRILFAILLIMLPPRLLLQLFLIPGVILFPLTYYYLRGADYTIFAIAIFFCGLLTVAQMSYMAEYLPKVFPIHLRGTGGGFAINVGARMIGTMAATLNTEFLAGFLSDPGTPNPIKVANAAAVIGGGAFLLAFILSFLLPPPMTEEPTKPVATGPDVG